MLQSCYFFFPGCESASGFHSGDGAETSNSAGSALAAAALALGFASGSGVLAATTFGTTVLAVTDFGTAGLGAAGLGGVWRNSAGFALTASAAGAAAWGTVVAGATAPLAADPRPRAPSTEARRSTSMRNGCPEEYSAWNMTFHDWQIMRRRIIGSCWENWARRQSMVSTPFSSSSVRPSRMLLRSASMRRKKARRIRYPNRVKATSATGR